MAQSGTDLPLRRAHGRVPPSQRRCSQEDLAVSVVFPGLVTRESCCRFTCELLKHILHQRHQLPLPYEQLVVFSRKPQGSEDAAKKRSRMEELGNRQCQQTLSDLEELLGQLEILFTITPVPRVLLLLGGNPVNPKELYDINMEGVNVGNGEESLGIRPCLRQLFHALFVADPFSDLRATSLQSLVVMVQGQRECGTDWFKPKLNYKVPSRGHMLTVRLACTDSPAPEPGSGDYIWFQAPVIVKGFHN
ncbi:MAD2L1-binding protein isoform X2 [Xenopus laevis]|nr:MAD2L1-binding protein isoform X2 [Xenopus laevis]XP_018118219.1 MAD2L1-binding protein isoform X2 [Xenopus laevis]XP_041418538.1 MAD2L1-binding protein isoform X2 [Xenopus laevis]